jgi:hypothetical protein
MPATPPQPTGLKDAMEKMRASMAGRETERGLAGMVQEMMLRFLTLLMAMLADFRAGKLVPPAPNGFDANPAAPRAEGSRHAADGEMEAAGRVEFAAGEMREVYPPPRLVRFAAQPPTRGEGVAGTRGELGPASPALVIEADEAWIPGFTRMTEKGVKSATSRHSRAIPKAGPGGDAWHRGRGFAPRRETDNFSVAARAAEEGGPALYRARAPRISPPSARAAGGCIQATRRVF